MSTLTDLFRRMAALVERLSPRERLLLGIGTAAGLMVAVWALAGFLSERRTVLQAQIAASEREVVEMGRLRDRYLQLRAERDVVRRKLERGGSDFSLFSHLEGVARDTLSRDRVAAMNPSTRTVAEDLQEEDVEMRLSGVSLRELVALLYRVEKSDLPLLVSRVQMKKRFDQPFVYDATLVIGRLRPMTASSTP
jgi:general secretion pathway protein M